VIANCFLAIDALPFGVEVGGLVAVALLVVLELLSSLLLNAIFRSSAMALYSAAFSSMIFFLAFSAIAFSRSSLNLFSRIMSSAENEFVVLPVSSVWLLYFLLCLR